MVTWWWRHRKTTHNLSSPRLCAKWNHYSFAQFLVWEASGSPKQLWLSWGVMACRNCYEPETDSHVTIKRKQHGRRQNRVLFSLRIFTFIFVHHSWKYNSSNWTLCSCQFWCAEFNVTVSSMCRSCFQFVTELNILNKLNNILWWCLTCTDHCNIALGACYPGLAYYFAAVNDHSSFILRFFVQE